MYRGVEMKKLLLALTLVVLSLHAHGATTETTGVQKLKVNYQAMAIAIDKFIDPELVSHRTNAIRKYNELYDLEGISIDGIKQVCTAGLLDKKECSEFVEFLTQSMRFVDVCKKSPAGEWKTYCINTQDFSFPTDVAQGMLKLVFDIYHGDEVKAGRWKKNSFGSENALKLVCEDAAIDEGTVRCNAPLHKKYLTAKFKSVTKGVGAKNKSNFFSKTKEDLSKKTLTSPELNMDALDFICKMVGGTYSRSNKYAATYQFCQNMNQKHCEPLGQRVNAYFDNLNIRNTYLSGKPACKFTYTNAKTDNKLRSCFGLNSYIYSDATIQASQQIHNYIRKYVNSALNNDLYKFDCADSSKEVFDEKTNKKIGGAIECKISKASNKNDICTMDFIFADTKENSKQWQNAGMQVMSCNVIGGKSTTDGCIGVDQQQCQKIIDIGATQCPLCAKVVWDAQNGLCILPDQAIASAQERDIKNMEQKVEMAVAITLSAATVITTPNPMTVAGFVLVVSGETVAYDARRKMQDFFDKYEKDVSRCVQSGKKPDCAKELLSSGKLNEAIGYSGEYTDKEIRSLNNLVPSLINVIPDNDTFWQWYLDNPDYFDCDEKGVCTLKANAGELHKQKKLGEGMAFAGAIMQLFGAIFHNQLQQISKALGQKVTAYKSINGLANSTDDIMRSADDVIEIAVADHGKAGLRLRNVNALGQKTAIPSKNLMQTMFNGNSALRQTAATYVGLPADKVPGMTKQIIDTYNLSVGSKIWVDLTSGAIHTTRPMALAQGVANATQATSAVANLTNIGPRAGTVASAALLGTAQAVPGAYAIFNVLNEGGEFFLEEEPIEISVAKTVAVPAVVPATTEVVTPVRSVNTTPEPTITPTPLETLPGAPIVADVPEMPTVPTAVTVPTVTPTVPAADVPVSNTTPYVPEKKDHTKTALIAGAAVLGAVGTGVLVGTLVSGGDKSDNASANARTSDLDNKINNIMMSAGAVGFIGNNNEEIRIVPLPTTANSNAPIVSISDKPVVVVEYRNHKFPFYLNQSTMSWAPLLGIGENGGWFNVYPPKPNGSGIGFIDDITQWLNQKLTPSDVMQFVGQNATGVQYPTPRPDAYKIINAEFPNGVIQNNSGTLTPVQQAIYNSNYDIIRTLFKFAQIWANFFYANIYPTSGLLTPYNGFETRIYGVA